MSPIIPRLAILLRKPKIIAGCVGAFLILIIAYSIATGGPEDTRRFTEAIKGDFTIDLVESGEIRSTFSYDLNAPMVWGNLQIMELAPEGSMVKKGDIVVRFDPSSLENEFKDTKEHLDENEAALKALDTEQAIRYAEMVKNLKNSTYTRELAELKKERMKYESPLQQRQAELEYQRQMLVLDEEETRLKNQKIIDKASRMSVLMNYEQTKSNLDTIERMIKELVLRAPIDGLVVYKEVGGRGSARRKVQVGDKPWPRQTIISIPDPNNMEAVMRVNEVDAGKLTPGDKATLSLDAFEQTSYTGEIISIARLADKKDSNSNIKDFEVVIKIANPDSMLKPGMTVRGNIVTGRIPNVVYVSAGAVFEDAEGKPVVFKRKGPQKPTPVTLGKRNDRFVIVAEGLRPGEEISYTPPLGTHFYPLGRARDMDLRKKELTMLMATPDSAFTAESRAFKANQDSASAPGHGKVGPGGGGVVPAGRPANGGQINVRTEVPK